MKYKFIGDGPKGITGFDRVLTPNEEITNPSEVAWIEKMPQNAVRALFVPVREPKKIATPTAE